MNTTADFDSNDPAAQAIATYRRKLDERGIRSCPAIRQEVLAEFPDAAAALRTYFEKEDSQEQRAKLTAMLALLTDFEREAIRLRYFENRSLAEIATQMNRTVMATAGLVKRGLLKLRANTSANPGDDLPGS